uniref:GLTSCR1 domain-containing protein n=1 Tax=Rhabditophanes sp. KR3021 TaxID=114890 RepID=A0AC35TYQ6_9BILA
MSQGSNNFTNNINAAESFAQENLNNVQVIRTTNNFANEASYVNINSNDGFNIENMTQVVYFDDSQQALLQQQPMNVININGQNTARTTMVRGADGISQQAIILNGQQTSAGYVVASPNFIQSNGNSNGQQPFRLASNQQVQYVTMNQLEGFQQQPQLVQVIQQSGGSMVQQTRYVNGNLKRKSVEVQQQLVTPQPQLKKKGRVAGQNKNAVQNTGSNAAQNIGLNVVQNVAPKPKTVIPDNSLSVTVTPRQMEMLAEYKDKMNQYKKIEQETGRSMASEILAWEKITSDIFSKALIEQCPGQAEFLFKQLFPNLQHNSNAGNNGKQTTPANNSKAKGGQAKNKVNATSTPANAPAQSGAQVTYQRRIPKKNVISKPPVAVPLVQTPVKRQRKPRANAKNTVVDIAPKPAPVSTPVQVPTFEEQHVAPAVPSYTTQPIRKVTRTMAAPVVQKYEPPPPPITSKLQQISMIDRKRAERMAKMNGLRKQFEKQIEEVDISTPFANKEDAFKRLICYSVYCEPDFSEQHNHQFDHELLRIKNHQDSAINAFKSKLHSKFYNEAIEPSQFKIDHLQFLHMDVEYERRRMAKERKLENTLEIGSVIDHDLVYGMKSSKISEMRHRLRRAEKDQLFNYECQFSYDLPEVDHEFFLSKGKIEEGWKTPEYTVFDDDEVDVEENAVPEVEIYEDLPIKVEEATQVKPPTKLMFSPPPQPSTFIPSVVQASTFIPSIVQPSTFIPSVVQPPTFIPPLAQPPTSVPLITEPDIIFKPLEANFDFQVLNPFTASCQNFNPTKIEFSPASDTMDVDDSMDHFMSLNMDKEIVNKNSSSLFNGVMPLFNPDVSSSMTEEKKAAKEQKRMEKAARKEEKKERKRLKLLKKESVVEKVTEVVPEMAVPLKVVPVAEPVVEKIAPVVIKIEKRKRPVAEIIPKTEYIETPKTQITETPLPKIKLDKIERKRLKLLKKGALLPEMIPSPYSIPEVAIPSPMIEKIPSLVIKKEAHSCERIVLKINKADIKKNKKVENNEMQPPHFLPLPICVPPVIMSEPTQIEKKVHSIKMAPIPEIEKRKIPSIKIKPIPEIEKTKLPSIKIKPIPEIEKTKLPSIKIAPIPEIEKMKIPKIEKMKLPPIKIAPIPETEKKVSSIKIAPIPEKETKVPSLKIKKLVNPTTDEEKASKKREKKEKHKLEKKERKERKEASRLLSTPLLTPPPQEALKIRISKGAIVPPVDLTPLPKLKLKKTSDPSSTAPIIPKLVLPRPEKSTTKESSSLNKSGHLIRSK